LVVAAPCFLLKNNCKNKAISKVPAAPITLSQRKLTDDKTFMNRLKKAGNKGTSAGNF